MSGNHHSLLRGSDDITARGLLEQFLRVHAGPYHVHHQDQYMNEEALSFCGASTAFASSISDRAIREYPGAFEDVALCSTCMTELVTVSR